MTISLSEGIDPLLGLLKYERLNKNRSYSSTNFQAGVQFETNKGYLNGSFIYQLQGNLKKNLPSFTQKNHFIGADFSYRFQKEKKNNLFMGLSLLSEVKTNYKNKQYDVYGSPTKKSKYDSEYDIFYARYYYSTPFVGALRLGYDFQVIENLKINVAIENTIRVSHLKTSEWKSNEPTGQLLEDLLAKQSKETMIIDAMGFRFGISYYFSKAKM
jgi:hypothetical protein